MWGVHGGTGRPTLKRRLANVDPCLSTAQPRPPLAHNSGAANAINLGGTDKYRVEVAGRRSQIARQSNPSLSLAIMASNAEFIASIEALLAAAKSYNVDEPDRIARANMLAMVEDLHYKLEAPEEAMFRQLTNVRPFPLSIEDAACSGAIYSTRKPQPFERCAKWTFSARYPAKAVYLPKTWHPALIRTRKY